MKKLEPRKAKGRAQGHMATSRHVGDRSPEVLPLGTPLRGVWKVAVNRHLSKLHNPLLAKGRAWPWQDQRRALWDPADTAFETPPGKGNILEV